MYDVKQGYKQTTEKKKMGRRNTKQLKLRPSFHLLSLFDSYRKRFDIQQCSDQQLIEIGFTDLVERIIIDEMCEEDETMKTLIKDNKTYEEFYQQLIDNNFNQDQRRRVIRILENQDDEYQKQKELSLMRRGRLNR